MHVRALARLAVVCVAAGGVLALAGHLDRGEPSPGPATSSTGASAGAATRAVVPPVRRVTTRTAARERLEQAFPAGSTGSTGWAAGARPPLGAVSGSAAAVDESLPHSHAVDPETGGLVAVTGATGVVGAAERLGAIHVDPMPHGVTLADPTDTDTLLDRASIQQPGLAGSEDPFAAGAASPVGTPGVASLSRHLAPSCSGTGVDGNRVQALYVHEASRASRYTAVLPILRNEIANVDDVFGVSAEQTGGQRRVRWVHTADCQPVVKDVTVPKGTLGSDFWATISALQRQGYSDPHRKYLMFADAGALCGIGTVYDDARLAGNANDGAYASYARVDAGCWSSGHSVAAHELTHNLGGVLKAAPHATAYGHCFDESDLMCYDDGSGKRMQQLCASAQEQLLDCNHDDYFSTKPAAGTFLAKNWNTARSSFLDAVVAPVSGPQVSLTSSATAVRTGQHVTLTASSPRTVSWTWARSASGSGCTLTAGTSGRADLVCPSEVTGTVTVTATASEAGTAAKGSAEVDVAVSRSAAPTARATAPATARAGTGFAVSVAATGTAPFGYQWSAGPCTPTSPTDGYTGVSCPAGTPTQTLTLSVLVTQADGQRVRATAPVQLSGAIGQATPTTAVTTAWSAPDQSAPATLSARLRDGTGASLSGRPVTLQVRWAGTSAWVAQRALATDDSGLATATVSFPRAGWFRFGSTDAGGFRGSSSAEAYVKVATRLQLTAPARRQLLGTLSTTSGDPIAGARVTLERLSPGSTRWVAESTLTTGSQGTVSQRVTPSGSTYYRWVFPGGDMHLAVTSPQLAVS